MKMKTFIQKENIFCDVIILLMAYILMAYIILLMAVARP